MFLPLVCNTTCLNDDHLYYRSADFVPTKPDHLKTIDMKKIGLMIMVVGLAISIFTGFSFFTREKVVDLGSVEIRADKKHDIQWSPILGLVIAGVGGALFFFGEGKKN